MQFTTTTSFFALLLALFSMISLANAVPIGLEKKDVFVPLITYPTTGTVWKVGSEHHVRWSVFFVTWNGRKIFDSTWM